MRGVRYEPQSRRIRDVREMLEFLRDFSLGGGLHPEGFGDEPFDEKADDKGSEQGHAWTNPFSEN